MVERVIATLAVRHVHRQPDIVRLQLDIYDAMARLNFDCMIVSPADFDNLPELQLQEFAEDHARVE